MEGGRTGDLKDHFKKPGYLRTKRPFFSQTVTDLKETGSPERKDVTFCLQKRDYHRDQKMLMVKVRQHHVSSIHGLRFFETPKNTRGMRLSQHTVFRFY